MLSRLAFLFGLLLLVSSQVEAGNHTKKSIWRRLSKHGKKTPLVVEPVVPELPVQTVNETYGTYDSVDPELDALFDQLDRVSSRGLDHQRYDPSRPTLPYRSPVRPTEESHNDDIISLYSEADPSISESLLDAAQQGEVLNPLALARFIQKLHANGQTQGLSEDLMQNLLRLSYQIGGTTNSDVKDLTKPIWQRKRDHLPPPAMGDWTAQRRAALRRLNDTAFNEWCRRAAVVVYLSAGACRADGLDLTVWKDLHALQWDRDLMRNHDISLLDQAELNLDQQGNEISVVDWTRWDEETEGLDDSRDLMLRRHFALTQSPSLAAWILQCRSTPWQTVKLYLNARHGKWNATLPLALQAMRGYKENVWDEAVMRYALHPKQLTTGMERMVFEYLQFDKLLKHETLPKGEMTPDLLLRLKRTLSREFEKNLQSERLQFQEKPWRWMARFMDLLLNQALPLTKPLNAEQIHVLLQLQWLRRLDAVTFVDWVLRWSVDREMLCSALERARMDWVYEAASDLRFRVDRVLHGSPMAEQRLAFALEMYEQRPWWILSRVASLRVQQGEVHLTKNIEFCIWQRLRRMSDVVLARLLGRCALNGSLRSVLCHEREREAVLSLPPTKLWWMPLNTFDAREWDISSVADGAYGDADWEKTQVVNENDKNTKVTMSKMKESESFLLERSDSVPLMDPTFATLTDRALFDALFSHHLPQDLSQRLEFIRTHPAYLSLIKDMEAAPWRVVHQRISHFLAVDQMPPTSDLLLAQTLRHYTDREWHVYIVLPLQKKVLNRVWLRMVCERVDLRIRLTRCLGEEFVCEVCGN